MFQRVIAAMVVFGSIKSRYPPTDARQWPQDTKDLHGLHQTGLRGDNQRNEIGG